MKQFSPPPKKYQPVCYPIIYEDWDILVGNKAAGYLTVAAKFDSENTIHAALNNYIRKGQAKSSKCVYVVHRLDQPTTGVLIFAKTEAAQMFLKDNWAKNEKIYLTIVHGRLKNKSGRISSQLVEDEDYIMHSSTEDGKMAHTEYEVLRETDKFSLLKVKLITGRKNQIRVHMSEAGNPIVGDTKYGDIHGDRRLKIKNLVLHAATIKFNHPHSRERMKFSAPVPDYFRRLVNYDYDSI